MHHAGGRVSEYAVRVLDFDPELGQSLENAAFEVARARLVTPVTRLRRGGWDPDAGALHGADAPLGLLVLEGLVTRTVTIGGRSGVELLGSGDLVNPWDGPLAAEPAAIRETWDVLEAAALAVLDREFQLAAVRFPELMVELLFRAARRARSQGVLAAVSHVHGMPTRVLILLWYLAQRWGRVRPDGVVLPLRISQGTLAQLVGARRPSVNVAVNDLVRAGLLERPSRASWLLPRGTLDELVAASLGVGAADDPRVCAADFVTALAPALEEVVESATGRLDRTAS